MTSCAPPHHQRTRRLPKLQHRWSVAANRAAQTVQGVIKRDVLQLLKHTGQRPRRQIFYPARWTAPARKINTSVTMLSMPSMRLDVPKRHGFADTADKTFGTKARSWIGSAHRGPPSCRTTEAAFHHIKYGLHRYHFCSPDKGLT